MSINIMRKNMVFVILILDTLTLVGFYLTLFLILWICLLKKCSLKHMIKIDKDDILDISGADEYGWGFFEFNYHLH
jgi:hypothetical protein